MDRLIGNLQGPVENHAFETCGFRALFGQPSVNLFKEAWHRRNHGRLNLQQRLRHLINGWNVRDGATLKNVDVIDDAPINMGKGQERKRDIFGGVEAEIVAHVGHVGTKVGVREHHALRLAGGAGGVDEGGKLAGQNLRSAQAVGRNLRGSSAGNECFVAQAFAGKIRAGVGHDNVLEFGKMGAHG